MAGFVLQYIIWRLKMASFPRGKTKSVRRQANLGREGMRFGEKQPPHPTQRKADLSEHPFKKTFSSPAHSVSLWAAFGESRTAG